MNILYNSLIEIGMITGLIIGAISYLFGKGRKIGQQDIVNKTNEEILEHVKEDKKIEHNINNLTHSEHIKLLRDIEKDD